MLLAALLLTLFDNRGVPEDAVTVTKSKTSGQAPEYASITSSSSLPSSGVSSSSSAASSSSSPNDTSSGTPPLADTVIRVFASEWLMTMVGIAMTLLAVFLAIHMNPSDKFIMGGFAPLCFRKCIYCSTWCALASTVGMGHPLGHA